MKLDENRLAHDERFALEPILQLGPGPLHTSTDWASFETYTFAARSAASTRSLRNGGRRKRTPVAS